MKIQKNAKGQAITAPVQHIGKDAFGKLDWTEIRWMGSASLMINSRGTNIMIDPMLEGFDMPLLFDMPIFPHEIPSLDAILITHIDNDHFSRPTCKSVKDVCKVYHAPQYVAEEIRGEGLSGVGHDIHESFYVNDIKVTLTPAWHNWQNESRKWAFREWKREDYCGFWLDTPDGSIWTPGDSRLLEEQLQMPQPDVLLFDFADNDWHITFDGAVKLANTYPDSEIICIHWGTVDAPEWSTFNGNPEELAAAVVNPERVHALTPGEAFKLAR